MPINVFGNSKSNDNGNKKDFGKKIYLRTTFIEANNEKTLN